MAENKIVVGRWEVIALLVNSIIVQVILNYPRSMVEIGGSAGWMTAVYITILALIAFFVIEKLYSRFEGKDLMDLGELAGGIPGKVFVGFVLLFHVTFIISMTLREFSEDMKVIALNVTPISVVTLFFLAGMMFGAFMGIEALFRFSAIAVPVIIGAYLIIVIAVAKYCDYTNLFPILGTGAFNLFGKGFFRLSSFSALQVLFLSFPFIKTNRNFRHIGYTAIGISSFFLISSSLIYIMVFRYGYAMENFLPVFQLSRLINYGRFFERVESVFVLTWAISAFMYLTMGFFFSIYVFKKTFGLKYYRPLILPFAVVFFTISLIPGNLMTVINLESNYFRNFAWAITFGFTIILLIVARIVNKDTKSKRKKEA